MTPADIAVQELVVRYAGRREPALAGVDLTVAGGELVGVAGRTGAGKSTLALASAGFIPRVVRARTQGTVTVGGRAVLGAPAADVVGRVGIVFATPANQLSASKLTVREELAFGLENLGMARADMDARIDSVLDRLGIAHLAEREPFALSGGEQQRVAIASIVAMGTRALVLDEPTAQLDPGGTAAVATLLAELVSEGAAVLCAEHDPIILGRSDRCAVLDGGRVVADERPGRAIGSAVLGPIGLEAPTLVGLAEAAGLAPEHAFDEAAIAEALRSAAMEGRLPIGPAAMGEASRVSVPTPVWQPSAHGAPAAIEVAGLVHRYPGGLEAIRDVDIRIQPGETVAIVGQNGSGKTTLAKHFNGLLRPADGRVRVGELDAASERIGRLAAIVGFAFQNPDDQLFERSVEREIRFGPRNLGLSAAAIEERVGRAMDAVGLTAERGTNPYDLALSVRKLVALGSVLAMEPVILVLDEPTTGQDGPGIARVGAIVDAAHSAGRTVVAITHDMEFAARHFARVVVMREGRIVADGPPRQIFGVDLEPLLASTGLTPPPAARIAARLGLHETPIHAADLLAALVSEVGGPRLGATGDGSTG